MGPALEFELTVEVDKVYQLRAKPEGYGCRIYVEKPKL